MVDAGFAGLYMLRQYACQFSEDLRQEWHRTEKYASQPEILYYANHVADWFGLRDAIRFNTSDEWAVWNESALYGWFIPIEQVGHGSVSRIDGRFLSSKNVPDMEEWARELGLAGVWITSTPAAQLRSRRLAKPKTRGSCRFRPRTTSRCGPRTTIGIRARTCPENHACSCPTSIGWGTGSVVKKWSPTAPMDSPLADRVHIVGT